MMAFISFIMQILMLAFGDKHGEYRSKMMLDPKVDRSSAKYVLVFYGHLLWALGIMFFTGASAIEEFKTIYTSESPLGVLAYVGVCIFAIVIYAKVFKRWFDAVIDDEKFVEIYFKNNSSPVA